MRRELVIEVALAVCSCAARGQAPVTNTVVNTNAGSKIRSAEDGRLDLSEFLDERYGLHAGFDVAFDPDDAALSVQVGSAWRRP